MKRDNKKALYESIMTSVAKEVKKALNEVSNEEAEYYKRIDKETRRWGRELKRAIENVMETNDITAYEETINNAVGDIINDAKKKYKEGI